MRREIRVLTPLGASVTDDSLTLLYKTHSRSLSVTQSSFLYGSLVLCPPLYPYKHKLERSHTYL
ncbi:hypothetical protein [Nostoc sp.]|uniref:hypothetical protein n=1 Tax=Nostoc sp. TaxID=1180 RepID=UPI002FF8A1F5